MTDEMTGGTFVPASKENSIYNRRVRVSDQILKGLIYLFEVPFEESQFYFQGLDCIWIIHFFFLGGARNARKSKASGGIDCAGTSFWEKILIGFKFI